MNSPTTETKTMTTTLAILSIVILITGLMKWASWMEKKHGSPHLSM